MELSTQSTSPAKHSHKKTADASDRLPMFATEAIRQCSIYYNFDFNEALARLEALGTTPTSPTLDSSFSSSSSSAPTQARLSVDTADPTRSASETASETDSDSHADSASSDIVSTLPYAGVQLAGNCIALSAKHGIFAQCMRAPTKGASVCTSCAKKNLVASNGTIHDRLAHGIYEYVPPSGKILTHYTKIIKLKNYTEENVRAHAKLVYGDDVVLSPEHFATPEHAKKKGRPRKIEPQIITETNDENMFAQHEQTPPDDKKRQAIQASVALIATVGKLAPSDKGNETNAKVAKVAEEDSTHLVAEATKADQKKLADDAKADQKKLADDAKADQKKLADDAKAEQKRLAEEQKRLVEEAKAEQKRLAEEAKAEQKRLAEEAKAEQKKLADDAKVEQKRLADEAKAKQKKLADDAKAEQKKLADDAKAEKKRIAAEAAAEKKRIATEAAAEKKRLAAEAKELAAEKKRIATETKELAAEQKRISTEEKKRILSEKANEDQAAAAPINQTRSDDPHSAEASSSPEDDVDASTKTATIPTTTSVAPAAVAPAAPVSKIKVVRITADGVHPVPADYVGAIYEMSKSDYRVFESNQEIGYFNHETNKIVLLDDEDEDDEDDDDMDDLLSDSDDDPETLMDAFGLA